MKECNTSVKWPLVAMQGEKQNEVLIINVFTNNSIRVDVPGDRINKINISPSDDIFVLSEIDETSIFSRITNFTATRLFDFKRTSRISDIFVRAPSQSMKEELFVFMISG